ncbi:MAG: arylamine N-acetyltransferase [Ardenticatenaceae bacterium]|nr:arylamine N-acetyltransferase [Ardenticatenaceae bacterium]
MTPPLDAALVQQVLDRFNLAAASPTPDFLAALLEAYAQTVPWESAFRMVKRAQCGGDTAVCPRWPAEFWQDHLQRGGGGTCFESNYAFFSLLRALGFEGYLTINNMGETVGCHTAIVAQLEGLNWLVDAGFPLYAPLLIDPQGTVGRASRWQQYTVRPDGRARYQIERAPHPKPNAFTLIDEPVSDAAYRAAATADYGPNGLFLDRVIINKVVNGRPYRYNAAENRDQMESFSGGRRIEHALDGDPVTAVAAHFQMDAGVLRAALELQASS